MGSKLLASWLSSGDREAEVWGPPPTAGGLLPGNWYHVIAEIITSPTLFTASKSSIQNQSYGHFTILAAKQNIQLIINNNFN